MNKKTKVLTATSLVIVFSIAISFLIMSRGEKPAEVRMEVVTYRDLTETVTANGNIRAGRVVDMSSDVSARVSELLIEEGNVADEYFYIILRGNVEIRKKIDAMTDLNFIKDKLR